MGRAHRGWRPAVALGVLLAAPSAFAQPHPWPFDFDPEKAEDPSEIREKLEDLGRGLPGLPTTSMSKLEPPDVDLWLFRDIAEIFLRARAAGPIAPAPTPVPTMCALHSTFVLPRLLSEPASAACEESAREIAASFTDGQACLLIEFPESFVRDLPPAEVNLEVVSSIEGLIGLIGEALTHFDMPAGLVPEWFMPTARRIIAKVRKDRLEEAAGQKAALYDGALAVATARADCFDAAKLATFRQDVERLSGELRTARSWLDRLVADGLVEAERDRARVLATGRRRPALPYPSLTDRERELLAAYLGGFTWRMRGRGLVEGPSGTQGKRLYFALKPFNAIGELVGGDDGDDVGVGIALGLLRGWGDLTDMGHTPGENDKYSDLVDLTDRGLYQVSFTEPDLEDLGYDTRAYVAGGLQMGPCYYYPWEFSTMYIGVELTDPYVIFIDGPGASGEFCAGAALGLGLAKSMLQGTCAGGGCACVPDCTGRACGNDGCGGVCGTCAGGSTCVDESRCEGSGPGPDAGGGETDAGSGGDDSGGGPIEDGGAIGDVGSSEGGPLGDDATASDAQRPEDAASTDVDLLRPDGGALDADCETGCPPEDEGDQDSGGCRTSRSSPLFWMLLILPIAVMLRRRRS